MRPFDDLARDYDELLRDPLRDRFASGCDFFIEQKARIVSRRLEALQRRLHLSRPLRVLDAGCGRGTAFQFFGPDVRVFGCDVSAGMLRDAATRPVVVQEPYALPFPDSTFDVVYAMCVYHHIPADEQLKHLRELRRVVREGGEVMVFEHNPYNPVTGRVFRRTPIDAGCEMIRPSQLRVLFHGAGFASVDQGYLLFVPEAVHRALPFIEPALAWLPLGGQYFVAGTKTASAE